MTSSEQRATPVAPHSPRDTQKEVQPKGHRSSRVLRALDVWQHESDDDRHRPGRMHSDTNFQQG